MGGKTRRVKHHGGAPAYRGIEREFAKTLDLYKRLEAQPSTTPEEISLLKTRAQGIQRAISQELDRFDNNGIDPHRSYLYNILIEEDRVPYIIHDNILPFVRLEERKHRDARIAQRQAVAVTGAHPESTMPSPDVASMVGKFLGGQHKTRKLKLKSIKPSHKKEKKWDATFVYPDGHQKVVPFGAKGMSDYTKHRDDTRKQRYLKRHSGMGESWQKPDTPGALAKWVLWNKKTLRASISDYKRRFKL